MKSRLSNFHDTATDMSRTGTQPNTTNGRW